MKGLVTKLLSGAQTPTVNSDTLTSQATPDSLGTSQIYRDSGSGDFTVQIQGRIASDAPWAIVAEINVADLDANDSNLTEHAMLTEMRHSMTSTSGTSVMSSYIME